MENFRTQDEIVRSADEREKCIIDILEKKL